MLSLFKAFFFSIYLFDKSIAIDVDVVDVVQDHLVAAHECTITDAFSLDLGPSEAQTQSTAL